MLATCRVTTEAPTWAGRGRADAWLIFGEDYAAPLSRHGRELVARTLLFRGAVQADRRQRLNERRAHRQAIKRARRTAYGERHQDRPHSEPQAAEWGDG